MSNSFRCKKYCQFRGLTYNPGDANNLGEGLVLSDREVMAELAKDRHPTNKVSGQKFNVPMSHLFVHFDAEELSEYVEPYVIGFMKGESFEKMLKTEAESLDINTKDMTVNALIAAISQKKNKPADDSPENLNKMKVPALKEKAGDLDIPGFDKMKRDELIEAIQKKEIENAG